MSDGLKLISAALEVGAAAALLQVPQEYYVDTEQTILEYVRRHYRRHRELPAPATVHQETGTRLPRAEEPVSFYVDKVYERHMYNAIRDRFGTLREAIRLQNLADAAESVNAMAAACRQNTRRGLESLTLTEAADQFHAWREETEGMGGITGVETPWPGFNDITGGYQRSDLITQVARPGLGKTYIALLQAWSAFQSGEQVLFVTTEMSAMQIARRHASIALGINPEVLRKNQVSTYLDRRLRAFYRDMAGADGFRIFSVGMNATMSSVEAFMQEFMPTFVVIDGVYLIRPSGANTSRLSRSDKVAEVFNELKGINLDANVPMVVTTQFNRVAGKGGKDGTLETIGYSDAIGTHSSVVNALKFGPTRIPYLSRYLEFLKGREGESGSVAINFRFAPLNMNEMTRAELEEAEGRAATETTTSEGSSVDWMA